MLLHVSTNLHHAYFRLFHTKRLNLCDLVRAHTAIILILTLTIDAFDPEGTVGGDIKVAGDFSAVFPLLTVSVYVALQISRQFVFYEKQRSRGDIMALPEVLCEPGKEGKPLVMDYDGNLHKLGESDYEYETEDESAGHADGNHGHAGGISNITIDGGLTQRDIEADFEARKLAFPPMVPYSQGQGYKPASDKSFSATRKSSNCSSDGSMGRTPSSVHIRPQDNKPPRTPTLEEKSQTGDNRLDELLNTPFEKQATGGKKLHRRALSEPQVIAEIGNTPSLRSSSDSPKSAEGKQENGTPMHKRKLSGSLVRVNSFGRLDQEQPSLIDQARLRAASYASAEKLRQRQLRQRSFSPNTLMPTLPRLRMNSCDSTRSHLLVCGPLRAENVDKKEAIKKEAGSDFVGRSPWTSNSS